MKFVSFSRHGTGWTRVRKVTALVGLALGAAVSAHADTSAGGSWPMAGQNYHNTRSQDNQSQLGVTNAGSLALKWSRTIHGDVSATPAVVNGVVYIPDWGGYLTTLNAATGALIWERRIDSYAGEPAGAVSRTSPAVVAGRL